MSYHVCPECGHLNGTHKLGCAHADSPFGCVVSSGFADAKRPACECEVIGDPDRPTSHHGDCPAVPFLENLYMQRIAADDHSVLKDVIVRPAPEVVQPFVGADPSDPAVQEMVDQARGRYRNMVEQLHESQQLPGDLAVVGGDGASSVELDVEVHFQIRPGSLGRCLKRFGMSKDLMGGGIAAAVERYLFEAGVMAKYKLDVTLSLQPGCSGVTKVKR